MLHRNHHYPFLSSTKLSSSFPQVEKGEMGRIVKGGLTPKMILEDVCFNNFSQPPQFHYSNFVVLDDSDDDNDDFFVDQLLNLNNNDGINPQEIITHQFQQKKQNMESSNNVLVNFKQQQEVDNEDKNTPFLSPPLDMAEEADLEWLSHFVDDSFCPYSTPFPPGYTNSTPEPKPELGSKLKPIELVEPTKCPDIRAKMWEKLCVGPMRKCSHCGVHKTPQWRNGPNGKRSLCNACGVRFKKGLLFPEYRPACSPTFSMELHSNLNRKVMEMRMMKECKPQVGLFHQIQVLVILKC